MKKLTLGLAAFVASTGATFAAPCDPLLQANCTPVPEISALEGMAAVAALAAVMLLVWERRRRAA